MAVGPAMIVVLDHASKGDWFLGGLIFTLELRTWKINSCLSDLRDFHALEPMIQSLIDPEFDRFKTFVMKNKKNQLIKKIREGGLVAISREQTVITSTVALLPITMKLVHGLSFHTPVTKILYLYSDPHTKMCQTQNLGLSPFCRVELGGCGTNWMCLYYNYSEKNLRTELNFQEESNQSNVITSRHLIRIVVFSWGAKRRLLTRLSSWNRNTKAWRISFWSLLC